MFKIFARIMANFQRWWMRPHPHAARSLVIALANFRSGC